MKKIVPYDNLPIVPSIVADTVCQTPYKGEEISTKLRDCSFVDKIETLRAAMTQGQKNEFIKAVDKRCRIAHENQYDWFVGISREKLYMWVGHWLSSYLNDREKFFRR